MGIFLAISLIVLFIALEGFFSGAETAIISINRIKLRHLVDAKVKLAVELQDMLNKPDRFLGTTLVGTNISVIASSAIFTYMVISCLGRNYEWLTTALLTPLILIFGEIIPKTVFRQTADRMALNLTRFLRLFFWLLYPIVWLVTLMSKAILGFLGQAKAPKKSPFVSREELRYLIKESEREGIIEPHARSIIYSIFDFSTKKVKDIMVPNKDIVSLPSGAQVKDLKDLVKRAHYSRIPIYQDSPTNFTGLVNILDVLYEEDQAKSLENFSRPVLLLSQEQSIDKILLILQLKRQQLALLVDNENKIKGLVTIEDLLEEIVGEM